MIDRDAIRRMIAQDLDSVRSVLLTVQQSEVLQFVMKNGATRSHAISSQFDLSPQHTSMIMVALYDKRYVSRAWRDSPSGGHEYEFAYRLTTDHDGQATAERDIDV